MPRGVLARRYLQVIRERQWSWIPFILRVCTDFNRSVEILLRTTCRSFIKIVKQKWALNRSDWRRPGRDYKLCFRYYILYTSLCIASEKWEERGRDTDRRMLLLLCCWLLNHLEISIRYGYNDAIGPPSCLCTDVICSIVHVLVDNNTKSTRMRKYNRARVEHSLKAKRHMLLLDQPYRPCVLVRRMPVHAAIHVSFTRVRATAPILFTRTITARLQFPFL